MKTVNVSLAERSYPIHISSHIIAKLPAILSREKSNKRCVLITDTHVAKLYAQQVVGCFADQGFHVEVVEFPAGEQSKSLQTFERIISSMVALGVGRDWQVIALGGGVVGDLAGYVAASYMRGVSYVQVPTTLLAQVDSSVGGKVGVNHPAAKNLIGAFYQPKLVLIDTDFLKTLPQREIVCGFAEIVKYGVIYDRDFFRFCETHHSKILSLDEKKLIHAIERSCQMKAEIVSKDEKDVGAREVLNFGHTIGHAIEASLGYESINHGEAILWGMLIESYIARALGIFQAAEFARFERFLAQIPLKASIDCIEQIKIHAKIALDKKVRNAKVRFVLPVSLGRAEVVENIDRDLIAHSISYALSKGWSDMC
jgi:3-dehydroquinate synthase